MRSIIYTDAPLNEACVSNLFLFVLLFGVYMKDPDGKGPDGKDPDG